jgi:hypothetical protein
MTCVVGEILEVGIDHYRYNLAIVDYKGVPSAIFAAYNEHSGSWTGVGVPHILRKFPDLLEQFAQVLKDNGYTLLTAPVS